MKKKNHLDRVLLIVLIAALAVVAAVIVYKQFEYKASEDFYNSLLSGDAPVREPARTFVAAPDSSAVPTADAALNPTKEPEITAAAEPEETAEMTSAVGSTDAPEAAATTEPTATIESTATIEPTATVEPTITPEPTLRPLTDEEVDKIVLALFGAVAGTDTKTERAIREQIEADIQNAAAAVQASASAQPTIEPTPLMEGTAQPTEKPLTTTEQIKLALEARSEELREYRAMTLPYLLAALKPIEQQPEPTATPKPSPTPDPSGAAVQQEVVYTVEDSFSAFEKNEFAQTYLSILEPLGGVDMESCLSITQQVLEIWFAQVDHEKLSWMNEDYIFWIYAPNTYIDYPVVQAEDNSKYLHRMFNGQSNAAGTLFIDYRNLSGFRDPNTLIYGHNMRNNSMFGALTDYEDQAYYEAHPYMIIFDGDAIYLVEVFAAYVTSDKDHCYDIAISGAEDMKAFVDTAVRKSDIETGVEVAVSDKLVTLSTCAYVFEDARYIAIGRLVPVWTE